MRVFRIPLNVLLPTLALLLVLSQLAGAHPPVLDNHNSCLGLPSSFTTTVVPMSLIPLVNSYVAPASSPGLDCGDAQQFGSEDGPCPAWPFVGASGAKFCGPIVAAGGAAICSATVLEIPQHPFVIVGFDGNGDGFVTLTAVGGPAETPVAMIGFGPMFVPGVLEMPYSSKIVNPLPVPARVIAYPTDFTAGGSLLPQVSPSDIGCR